MQTREPKIFTRAFAGRFVVAIGGAPVYLTPDGAIAFVLTASEWGRWITLRLRVN